jgi:hypothetical protein
MPRHWQSRAADANRESARQHPRLQSWDAQNILFARPSHLHYRGLASRACHRVSDFRARDHAHAGPTPVSDAASTERHSAPSLAETIQSAVAKQITDELQGELSRKKNAAAQPRPTGSAIPEKALLSCRLPT